MKFCASIGFLALAAITALAGPIKNTVPANLAKHQRISDEDSTTVLNLAVGLPLRNTNELMTLIADQQNPNSPNFHKFLTSDEFNTRFGPSEADYNATADFFEKQGFVVNRIKNRTVLDISGDVKHIEKTLHTKIGRYQHAKDNRTFHAPEVEPTIDIPNPLESISGLSNVELPRPANKLSAKYGSASNGNFQGKDFRNIYLPGVTNTGAGQKLAQIQFTAFYTADPTTYAAQMGIPAVPVRIVTIKGFTSTPEANNSEAALDIEMANCIAPGLTEIIEYCGGPTSSGDNVLNKIASDNSANQISCSWSWYPWTTTTENLLLQFLAQGQTFLSASGDHGAYDTSNTMLAPDDSPYITSVGGTALTTDGQIYIGETVWHDSDGLGSGGGISTKYNIPSWQVDAITTTNKGSSTKRNVPDIAILGTDINIVANNGETYSMRGTSASAPLMGAIVAIANQKAAAAGQPVIGFINPTLYNALKSDNYNTYFNDIVWGDNTTDTSPTKFPATDKYDLCTGVGTPTGSNFINLLVWPVTTNGIDRLEWAPFTAKITNNTITTVTAKSILNTTDTSCANTLSLSAYTSANNNYQNFDFENYSMMGFTSQGGGYTTANNIGGGANGSVNSISLTGGRSNAYDGFAVSIASIKPTHVEFWIQSAVTNKNCGYFVIGSSPASRANSMFHFHMEKDQFEMIDGVGNTYDVSFLPNQLYKISVEANWTTKRITWSVNDILVGKNIPFCNTNLNGVTTINIYSFDNATVIYDQIRLSDDNVKTMIPITPSQIQLTNGVWTGQLALSGTTGNTFITATDTYNHSGTTTSFSLLQFDTTVTLARSPTNGGTVTGGGTFLAGTLITISAYANAGWYFTGWNDGITNNPRAYTVPITNSTVIANFGQPATIAGQATFNAGNGTMQFNISGTIDRSYTVQKSTDLLNWVNIQTFTLTASTTIFTDPSATNQQRFYRIRLN